jgi:tetratricopeptide (TPR) repeat protein
LEQGLKLSNDPLTVEQAAFYFRKAIEVDPNYTLAYFHMGTMYYRWSHFQKAVELLKKAIELGPNEFASYMNLGMNFNLSGNYREAEHYLRKALELQPEYSEAHYHLAISLFQQWFLKDQHETIKHFRRAFELNPKHAMALHFLSWALIKSRDYDGARSLREEIRESHPGEVEDLDLLLNLNDPGERD